MKPKTCAAPILSFAILMFSSAAAAPAFADDAPAWTKKSYEIKQPTGKWQVPGEIQQPKDFKVPGDIQGVKVSEASACTTKLELASDVLFEFDKASLTSEASKSLQAVSPAVSSPAVQKLVFRGHTDSKGSDDYNEELAKRRAESVAAWFADHGFIRASKSIDGVGEKEPLVPNENADGSDNPDNRAKNRRVEIVMETCKAAG